MRLDWKALLHPQISRLFAAQFLSQICDKLMLVGVLWLLAEKHDPKWVPWFVAIGALPHLLLAATAPRLISRLGLLKTVVWTDVVRGLFFLAAIPLVTVATDSS